MFTTVLAMALKPFLAPLIQLMLRIPARCALLLVRRMPECWLKRFLTLQF